MLYFQLFMHGKWIINDFAKYCLLCRLMAVLAFVAQGGHKPRKPGVLGDFSEHGKLREFCTTSGENCIKSILVRHSNICYIAGVDVE